MHCLFMFDKRNIYIFDERDESKEFPEISRFVISTGFYKGRVHYNRIFQGIEIMRFPPSTFQSDCINRETTVDCIDAEVTLEEAELLRAFADSMGCPIPPFLPKVA